MLTSMRTGSDSSGMLRSRLMVGGVGPNTDDLGGKGGGGGGGSGCDELEVEVDVGFLAGVRLGGARDEELALTCRTRVPIRVEAAETCDREGCECDAVLTLGDGDRLRGGKRP